MSNSHFVQGHLFDGTGPDRAREGIDSALENQEDWQREAMRLCVPWLEQHAEFCADDMWRENLWPWTPRHPNAIGAFFRRLHEKGYIGRPVRWVYSKRTTNNSRRIPVYQSVLYRPRAHV